MPIISLRHCRGLRQMTAISFGTRPSRLQTSCSSRCSVAFDFWKSYEKDKKDWNTQNSWKVALAKIGGPVVVPDPTPSETRREWKGNVMSRDNPARRGKILIQKFDPNGVSSGYSLSSTRQTRDSAYAYLKFVAGLPVVPASSNASSLSLFPAA